ncbi:MAG: DUF1080 domain-containing protein [Pirellulales bacterium]|nr:DUF1080 domain-containing protein [Pirellulales bacterium]
MTRASKRFLSIFCLLAICFSVAVAVGAEEGFESLFDGKTLNGWDGDPKFWRVEDGAITGETTKDNPTKANTFIIHKGAPVEDFILKFDYRIRNHNSGVQYRSWRGDDWVVGGYQADMVVDTEKAPWSGILYEERGRGILAKRGQKVVIGPDHKPKVVGSVGDAKKLLEIVKQNEWKTFEVIARGNHLVHKINDRVMVDVVDKDPEKRKFSGILAFQLHAGPPMKVQFRNVRIKRLPAEKKKTDDKKKIVLIAGPKSHGYGAHEHNAGCLLLAKWINENVPEAHAVVSLNGWPKDKSVLDGAAAIVVFADGYGGHPINGHFDEVEAMMKRGVGLSLLHYATGVDEGKQTEQAIRWTGGVFAKDWSVNPHWNAKFEKHPAHEINRGVKPYEIEDEWYYNMRFPKDNKGIEPVLVAVPPENTRTRPYGMFSGNPTVRANKGRPEILAWAIQRPDGGRGFGHTGGHWHANWGDDNFRKQLLNSCLWVAGIEVPPNGVETKRPTIAELEANQDYPKPKDYDNSRMKRILAK